MNDENLRWLIGQIMKDFDFFDADDERIALEILRMHDPVGRYAKDWGFEGTWEYQIED